MWQELFHPSSVGSRENFDRAGLEWDKITSTCRRFENSIVFLSASSNTRRTRVYRAGLKLMSYSFLSNALEILPDRVGGLRFIGFDGMEHIVGNPHVGQDSIWGVVEVEEWVMSRFDELNLLNFSLFGSYLEQYDPGIMERASKRFESYCL